MACMPLLLRNPRPFVTLTRRNAREETGLGPVRQLCRAQESNWTCLQCSVVNTSGELKDLRTPRLSFVSQRASSMQRNMLSWVGLNFLNSLLITNSYITLRLCSSVVLLFPLKAESFLLRLRWNEAKKRTLHCWGVYDKVWRVTAWLALPEICYHQSPFPSSSSYCIGHIKYGSKILF